MKRLWSYYRRESALSKTLVISVLGIGMYIGQTYWAELWKRIWAALDGLTVEQAYPPAATTTQIGDVGPLVATAIFVAVLSYYSFEQEASK